MHHIAAYLTQKISKNDRTFVQEIDKLSLIQIPCEIKLNFKCIFCKFQFSSIRYMKLNYKCMYFAHQIKTTVARIKKWQKVLRY